MIETERLWLRRLTTDDAAFVLELLNEPSFIRHIGDRGVRTTADAVLYVEKGPLVSYARSGYGLYLVLLKESGEPMGICGLLKRDWLEEVDVGFAFQPPFWARGYATEAAGAVLGEARDHGFDRVLAITSLENVASIRLLEKLGFRWQRTATPPGEAAQVNIFVLDLRPR